MRSLGYHKCQYIVIYIFIWVVRETKVPNNQPFTIFHLYLISTGSPRTWRKMKQPCVESRIKIIIHSYKIIHCCIWFLQLTIISERLLSHMTKLREDRCCIPPKRERSHHTYFSYHLLNLWKWWVVLMRRKCCLYCDLGNMKTFISPFYHDLCQVLFEKIEWKDQVFCSLYFFDSWLNRWGFCN